MLTSSALSAPIPVPQDLDFKRYDSNTQELLDEVLESYGQFSAWKLRDLTHSESPWKNAFKRDDPTIFHWA